MADQKEIANKHIQEPGEIGNKHMEEQDKIPAKCMEEQGDLSNKDLEDEEEISNKDVLQGSGFEDMSLKPELLLAIMDCGFEHPSEVQRECIPEAILGMDILCQAQQGMGKTVALVLATLQLLEPVDGQVSVLVMCHGIQYAFQIYNEYVRLCKYLPLVKIGVLCDGIDLALDEMVLTTNCPHIVIGTPRRIFTLLIKKKLNLKYLKHFVLNDCFKILRTQVKRHDVSEIFHKSSREKQVMMFSSINIHELRPVCKEFMHNPMEIYFEDQESDLTVQGVHQYYVKLDENRKSGKLLELFDTLRWNQAIVFVQSVPKLLDLYYMLIEKNFIVTSLHKGIPWEECLARYTQFQGACKGILLTTSTYFLEFGPMSRNFMVNVVLYYDMPENMNAYFQMIAKTTHFGIKRLIIMFVSNSTETIVLENIQDQLDAIVSELPVEIDMPSLIAD